MFVIASAMRVRVDLAIRALVAQLTMALAVQLIQAPVDPAIRALAVLDTAALVAQPIKAPVARIIADQAVLVIRDLEEMHTLVLEVHVMTALAALVTPVRVVDGIVLQFADSAGEVIIIRHRCSD